MGATRDIVGGAPSIVTGQVTVATTVGGTKVADARGARRTITVVQHGTTDVYLGNSGVTTSTGAKLVGSVGAALTLCFTGALYGIVASGTQAVSYVEEYDA